MPRVTIENARSRVSGLTPEHFRQLRRLISFRAQDLPPRAIQKLIFSYAEAQPGSSRTEAHLRFFIEQHREQLDAMGWAARLSPRVYEATLRSRGDTWDGWTSLVTRSGQFGTGLLPHVERALTLRLGFSPGDIEIVDQRGDSPAPGPPRVAPPSLYDFQQEAVSAWFLAGGRGVIDLPPRSGKTRIMIAIAAHLSLPTLIVVPSKGLVEQTVEKFLECGWPEAEVLGITGGTGAMTRKMQLRMRRALVWVATPQTAAGSRKRNYPGMLQIKSRRVLMIDEFHHSAAKTYQAISLAASNAYYRLGATGTFFRADGQDLRMHSILSRAVYKKTIAEMVALARLVPADVAMVRLGTSLSPSGYARLYQVGVTENDDRNQILAVAAQTLIKQGRRVLVLTKEVEHAKRLASLIGMGTVQVDGTAPLSVDLVKSALDRLHTGHVPCVVGTSVIGEGMDVPRADALVYAAGGRSEVKVVQDFFRCLTAASGKKKGIIVDVADDHVSRLTETAAHRLSIYRRCFSADVIDVPQLENWLTRAL